MNKMATRIVTLRDNYALEEISKMSDYSKDWVSDRIIDCLKKLNFIHDIPEECGETLQYVMDQNSADLEIFGVYCFHKCSEKLITLLKGIQLWGVEDDCDTCGCKMEESEDEKECINPVCGCTINTNFAIDPDMYRDDCPELLTDFNLN